jgi:hypothetical protein
VVPFNTTGAVWKLHSSPISPLVELYQASGEARPGASETSGSVIVSESSWESTVAVSSSSVLLDDWQPLTFMYGSTENSMSVETPLMPTVPWYAQKTKSEESDGE